MNKKDALPGRICKWNPRRQEGFKLFLIILPFLSLVFVFNYLPLYGWLYSLFDYRPPFKLFDTPYVGLKWFYTLVETDAKRKLLLQVLTNTFVLSGLSILTSWLPMAFAIFLTEIGNKPYKRMVQTLTTIPHFISWVLVYSLAFALFSNTGMVNSLLLRLGIIEAPQLFLQSGGSGIWLNMWLWSTWKGLGWSAIMYIAAIAAIDQELYEAAHVDGAGRFRAMWHITVPGLLSTYIVLLLMNVANFLNSGVEQYYVFQNAFNKDHIQVLDLFVYNLGFSSGSYSFATAVSILKSLVSLALLFTVNRISKTVRGEAIL